LSLVPMSVYFLQRYRPHRDLHSFPTRRSSDLDFGLGRADDHQVNFCVRIACQRLSDKRQHEVHVADPFVVANDQDAPDLVWAKADRKSTRLNSSHVKISYAVFCLKKKRTDQAS